jgi:hypothetical protein
MPVLIILFNTYLNSAIQSSNTSEKQHALLPALWQ